VKAGCELQAFNLQYPRNGARWTLCSLKSRFSALATASGRFRSCSAKSRSLPITSPVGYRPNSPPISVSFTVLAFAKELLGSADRDAGDNATNRINGLKSSPK
jgi:hypothetical protein